jgi:hypothetical protein
MTLPASFGRHTGDLDEMVKGRNIRALVILDPISFFYDEGQPRGVMYEALEEFQKFANQKLKTGKLQVKVTFLPMRVDQIEAALPKGLGDMIAYGIVITPDREKRVAFSTPIQTDVSLKGDVFAQIVAGTALTEVPSPSICPVAEDANPTPSRGRLRHCVTESHTGRNPSRREGRRRREP